MNADRTVAARSRTRPFRYLILLAFLAVGASAQTTYYTDATNGNDMYDGLAPVFDGTHGPKATIQAGIGVAVSGDTVQAAQGTYYETINFNGKDITVTGTDPDDPAVVQNTIINGGGDWENPATVVTFNSGETAAAVLTGLTVTCTEGLGISCTNGSNPTIDKNRIVNNTGMAGGGIDCYGASPGITNNTISNNSGMGRGGIYCSNGAAPLISGNTITGNSCDFGAGISCSGAAPTITGNRITGNSANQSGGGVYVYNASPIIENNLIAKNTAYNSGAGIYLDGASSTVARNTIADNSIADDYGTQYGGGLANFNGGMPVIANCIFWGNTLGGMPNQIYDDYWMLTVDYCDVQGGWSGTGNLDAAPLFADSANDDYHLESEGGRWDPNTGAWVTDTQTSACLDAGDPNADYSSEPTPNGDRLNLGAYGNTTEASKTQSANTPPVITEGDTVDVTMDEDGDPTPFSLTLHATDNEGDTLTWSVSVQALHGTATASGTGTEKAVQYTPETNWNGTDSFEVTVDDDNGGSDSILVTVTVNPQPDPPTISGTPETTVDEGEYYSFTPTASDPDAGDVLTFSIQNKPAWADFDTVTGALTGTPGPGDAGTTAAIVITVTDSTQLSASLDPFDLTVIHVNNPPELANPIPHRGTHVGDNFSYTFPEDTFTDPDPGDTLTYSAALEDGSDLPAWLAFDSATRTFSGMPGSGDVGAVNVRVTAADLDGETACDTFLIVVLEVGVVDTDADGLDDNWETAHFGALVAYSSGDDPDMDGALNFGEWQSGADPNAADTNADGLTDGAALTATLDPTAAPALLRITNPSDGSRLP